MAFGKVSDRRSDQTAQLTTLNHGHVPRTRASLLGEVVVGRSVKTGVRLLCTTGMSIVWITGAAKAQTKAEPKTEIERSGRPQSFLAGARQATLRG